MNAAASDPNVGPVDTSGGFGNRKRALADGAERPAGLGRPAGDIVRALPRHSLKELLKQVAPGEVVDPAVEDFLLDVADDFVDSVTMFACKLAVHRKSEALETKDIVVHLERAWDMVLPGLESNELQEYKEPAQARAHKRRMVEVRRAITSSGGTAEGAPTPQ
uniref:Transcription initiation factor TFIID subunit 12 domain-containing protein n=1 Tax=Mantoniella antarctica TaxID=81844 RepID=A0A7S0SVC0_9CHLO|mmetsp:Transcript_7704/g.12123  ORF Transcript_7704/g.12123 Transcript_7704/m.12123 type:complete len:163 (+) Transcript_7704:312-800(+)|eukprot:CAMPEP_0198688476 /NCGR_PEP_ID=MMETSP1468-20131203/106264_1 /TAXON_ID=1461545 /ORGANISM="Mantoniella sp, Strain CCMP1436" /LENGTH=162 /DNA_ID=CAMNT_0044438155 /DNA_START=289 /DNA_END=777 /DNA_ORIENTATION=+